MSLKGYDLGFVELDASLVNPPQQQQSTNPKAPATPTPAPPVAAAASSSSGKKKKYVLNSSDKLFSQFRDQNFAVMTGMLSKIAKRINENYEVNTMVMVYFHVSLSYYKLGTPSSKNSSTNT